MNRSSSLAGSNPHAPAWPVLAATVARDRVWFMESLFRVIESARQAGGAPPVPNLACSDRFVQANIGTAVDLLIRWLRSGDNQIKALLIGWLNVCANERLNTGRRADFNASPWDETWQSWFAFLTPNSEAATLGVIGAELHEIALALRRPAERELRLLVIGDCLLDDILSNLHGPCLHSGISLMLTTLAHRVPASLRNEIRKLSSCCFDLVFFSPFSHEFSAEYVQAIGAQTLFRSWRARAELLDAASADTAAAVALLAEQFECPIYVHNTAATLQHNSGPKGRAKVAMTAWRRRRARARINPAVRDLIAAQNAATFEHLFVLDEAELLSRFDAFELGRIWFDSGTLHPTLLGSLLGREHYFRSVYAQAFLAGRKVIVCDLDNTLWEGVIGEGAVRHLHERQRILRGLREKGLVLAINSKNDPERVRWDGATLREDDFVCAQINWGLKSQNIRRIRDELNLKVKDFLFLDDRPDERAQVKDAFPEIHVMDPTDSTTWALLEHWRRVLPNQVDEDRTRMYRERIERETFVANLEPVEPQAEDSTAAFRGLELHVLIREANSADMKRVAELINRTNQFNLCGSRTSVRELSSGPGRSRRVILAEARDKFGSMGTVGVIVVDLRGSIAEIPIFVLSCRVFGFGIEYAMLNALKRRMGGHGEIVGFFLETAHNKPCHLFYPSAGLTWDGEAWRGSEFGPIVDPEWLTVENRLPEATLAT